MLCSICLFVQIFVCFYMYIRVCMFVYASEYVYDIRTSIDARRSRVMDPVWITYIVNSIQHDLFGISCTHNWLMWSSILWVWNWCYQKVLAFQMVIATIHETPQSHIMALVPPVWQRTRNAVWKAAILHIVASSTMSVSSSWGCVLTLAGALRRLW